MHKFALYENAVQTPEVHVEHFTKMYKEIRGGVAHRLREDFCGTAKISCEWVKEHPKHRALGLDLDPETLQYGTEKHISRLKPGQRKRIQLKLQDVREVTRPACDLVVGCNFSYFIFKDRENLLKYFRAAYRSLDKKGLFVLELAGGPGMMETAKETRGVKIRGKKKFTYVWDQRQHDPITHEAVYAIHFRIPGQKTMKDAFVYDWRLWSIPETRDAMKDAGFSDSVVYWETEHKGVATGEYVQMEKGDNSYSWIAYIVGIR